MTTKANSAKGSNQATKNAPKTGKSGGKVVVCLNSAHSIVFEIAGRNIQINGSNENLRKEKEGILAVGRFGETLIDRQDWEEIKKVYGKMEIFKSGLIYAQENHASARSVAKEREKLRNGLEPVDTSTTQTKEDKGQ
ncbi:MAG: hypothetical protein NC323_09310 [Oxalobacter formigenes]|nr:hypothetical protein [Oxalobacter formigenes]